MKRNRLINLTLLSVMILLTMAGCQSAAPQVDIKEIQVTVVPSSPTEAPQVFKTSQPGSITVRGTLVVLDPTSLLPGPDDDIFLVPLDSEEQGAMTVPQFKVGEVPQAEVDEADGKFQFTNLKPGRYILVVMTKGGAQIPTRKMEDKTPAIFTFTDADIDKTIDLNMIAFP